MENHILWAIGHLLDDMDYVLPERMSGLGNQESQLGNMVVPVLRHGLNICTLHSLGSGELYLVAETDTDSLFSSNILDYASGTNKE